MLANLRKLADWDGSDLTTGFVEAQASSPEFIKMVWEMRGESHWELYQKDQGYKEQAQDKVKEELEQYDSLDKLKWSVKGPAGPLSKEMKVMKQKYEQVPPQLAVELYEQWLADLTAKYEGELKPKSATKKVSGSRSKFEGTDIVDGKEYEFESEDYKKAIADAGAKAVKDDNAEFKFVGDEDSYIPKSVISKDKTKRTWRCLPVSSTRDLGMGGSSKDDQCNGAVIWDKAGGSKALETLGMTQSAFRIRCGGVAEAEGFCATCMKKDDRKDFFKDKIGAGRGGASKYKDLTYAVFMRKNLKYVKVEGAE